MRRWAVGTGLAALPAGVDCKRVIVYGRSYWHCDDTYFNEVVSNGATVYVVVDP